MDTALNLLVSIHPFIFYYLSSSGLWVAETYQSCLQAGGGIHPELIARADTETDNHLCAHSHSQTIYNHHFT